MSLPTIQWLKQHAVDGVHLTIKQLLYYQGKTALLDLNPRRTNQARLAGAYLAKTKGRGMEFDEARHYQPGDDIRTIDWRVTARTGKTHTKLYREEKERPVFLLVDLSNSLHFGTQLLFKSVQAAHLASLIAWVATQRGDRIGGLVINNRQHLEFKPQTRHKAVLSLIQGMIQLHQSRQEVTVDFAASCARLRRLVRPGSLVCLISDFQHLDELSKQHLYRISRHSELIAYPISDPFEHQLPQVNLQQSLAITDEQLHTQVLLGEKQIHERYRQQQHRLLQQRLTWLTQCQAQILPISAAMTLEDQLSQLKKGTR